MKKCLILVGLPATGKSTWVDSLIDDDPYDKDPIADWSVHSTDNIVEEIADNYGFTYNEIWKDTIGLATKLYNRDIRETIMGKWSCIIDRTNLTIESRKKIIDLFKSHGYTIEVMVFSKPDDIEWNNRLNSREGKSIPKEQLDAMIERYQAPSNDEGIDEIYYV
jgi:predicted kinase